MIAIDLSKQQVIDDDPKATRQINFTANLDWAGNTTMLFIIEEEKEIILDFSQGTVNVFHNFILFWYNIRSLKIIFADKKYNLLICLTIYSTLLAKSHYQSHHQNLWWWLLASKVEYIVRQNNNIVFFVSKNNV